MSIPLLIKERFSDEFSLKENATLYCGKRLQTEGLKLYVVTGDYDNFLKQYITYLALFYKPTREIKIISMVENGKLYPWITQSMLNEINTFKNQQKQKKWKSLNL